jgi:RNAse (barnase) inhibitor barstar
MKDLPFTFISEERNLYPGSFVVRITSDISNKAELLSILARELQFPGYFGHNWDALSDCLRDFHWIETRQIVLIHEILPLRLKEHDLRTYLEILVRCIKDWKPGEDHELVVAFPAESYEFIKNLLSK